MFLLSYPKSCKLHQMIGNLDTNSDIRLVLQGRDENSRLEKRNKDDLGGRKKEAQCLRIVIKLKMLEK